MRKVAPSVLEPQEIQALLSELEQPFRLMVLFDVTTGLRRSELFALKWSDIDFWNLVIDIRRSICEGVVGSSKTEASRRPIPLLLDVAVDLWLLKENTNYAAPHDWVFASPRVKGKSSRRPDVVLTKIIQPAAGPCWNQEKDRLAYISAYVFNDAHCERRECEGGPGTDASCKQPLHVGCLHASENSREARSATTSRPDDPSRGRVRLRNKTDA
jgi:integrase